MTSESAAARFPCFGGEVAIEVLGAGAEDRIRGGAALALGIHTVLTRFDASSELVRFNENPALTVGATPILRSLAEAVRWAGDASGGLVDATCLDALELSGYRTSLGADHQPVGAVPTAGPRPAIPDPSRRWATIEVDEEAGTITRPPGVRIDSGGLGKGLAADLIAAELATCDAFTVDCGGDVRIGGEWPDGGRAIAVADPDPHRPAIADLRMTDCALATSGTRKRSWVRADGTVAHHLIDPGRGIPAHTGVVQATALAPTALEAEVLAKCAILTGRSGAGLLVNGGWMVMEDGSSIEVEPVPVGA